MGGRLWIPVLLEVRAKLLVCIWNMREREVRDRPVFDLSNSESGLEEGIQADRPVGYCIDI